MTTLRVTGLTKSFGQVRVLDGVDLVVPAGITAVLGASGCGKTTLLRLVAGFLEPDAGTIRLGDRVVAGAGRPVPPRGRRIGYVPQEGALFPHLDVTANIAFGLSSGRRSEAGRRRVQEMLDLVELPRDVGGRQPHELSGGQQQRVALARALAPAPDMVLLDEPFSSLDAGLREETGRAVARALRATEATAVLVTHDQGEALSLADQVAVMAAGRFLQVATPAAVYLDPASPAVASFVGHAALVPAQALAGSATSALGRVAIRGAGDGRVLLAVRPEQVTVTAADDPSALTAEVLEVSFFGHDATVRARVLGSAGPVDLTARVSATGVPAPGARIGVRVDGDVLAFPEDLS
ncbi:MULTISPECIES: ABC transporter ATP-binding protein [unclassified Nocardioides]|uniref:ABC transporter ATP-binding protein n=1 Tax=unclassified Nocardioides TaxID=2615069 RepID=UPI0009F0BAF2|nr:MULTISPECIES: ABC transporter ATP-binding protein [unclassified Nocardioides]GAW48109.1 ABC transporter-like protein [Nocardioides sp. PD653-B2]GAW53588.1 ABC transporter-like protein [Nocardioides sp. PD653]